jgi:PhoPQ-activated pathogenicity-related protein
MNLHALARCCGLATLLFCATASAQTALDEFIAADDGAFAYTQYAEGAGFGWRAHFLKMTSQRWRGEEDVDCARRLAGSWLDACELWQHELIVYVPGTISQGSSASTAKTAVLLIGGGDNTGSPTTDPDDFIGPFAFVADAVVVELRQVPNQPYFFDAEPGRERTEDEVLGLSIDRWFATLDPSWPALAPMTKSAVKAMDAAQRFIRDEYGFEIADFVVAGGSKRGWTTWLTAAVDDRVKAIMPASIEVHDLLSQLRHHHAGYGFFAPATVDYVEANLACQLENDSTTTLLELIDPNTYKDRYTMPKLLLNSTGDQFFAADSARFYYSGLPAPKQLRMAPNTDHGQSIETLTAGLQWLLDAVTGDSPGRDIDWSTDPDGTLRVTTNGDEQEVVLWQATNPDARDFRLENIGAAWSSTPLTRSSTGEYVVPPELPASGWTARLVEVRFDTLSLPGYGEFTEAYTTEIQVLPDTLPFEPFDCSQPLDLAAGLWWDPKTNGQGMDLNRVGDESVFGPWYLYDQDGKPLWVTFTGELEGTRARGVLNEFTGPQFGPGFDLDFDPEAVQPREVGQATIAFLGTDHGVFHYGFNELRGGFHRDLDIEQFDARPDGPYSGLWWNPQQSGHGFQFNQKDDAFFGTWYSYDENGDPLWYLYIGEMLDASSARADMYRFEGPPLSDGEWDQSLLLGDVVGEIQVQFSGASEATADVVIGDVTGQYFLQPFDY